MRHSDGSELVISEAQDFACDLLDVNGDTELEGHPVIESIDAIRTLGLDPIELLVLPRMLALLVMMPVLSFLATLAGMLGGGLVGIMELDLSPGLYLARMQEGTELRHLWVGLIKAPVFAFLIAVVGCLEGLKVEGSAASVGKHTTSAVVQGIFLVIFFDALFAVFFMKIGL